MEKPNLNKTIFWDVDFDKIDYQDHKRFVIERVFERGDLPDITQCRRFYGDNTIIDILTSAKFLMEDTVRFFAGYFDVPKENFRCYIEKQLNHQHSIY